MSLRSPISDKGISVGAIIFFVFATLLCTSNWILVRENRQLREELDLSWSTNSPFLHSVYPTLKGEDIRGFRTEIGYGKDGKKTLMLVFSPTCIHCKNNWSKWLKLVREFPDQQPTFVNIGGRVKPEFLSQFSIANGRLVAKTDPESMLKYSLRITPITALFDDIGRCLWVRSGELSEDDVSELRAELNHR